MFRRKKNYPFLVNNVIVRNVFFKHLSRKRKCCFSSIKNLDVHVCLFFVPIIYLNNNVIRNISKRFVFLSCPRARNGTRVRQVV